MGGAHRELVDRRAKDAAERDAVRQIASEQRRRVAAEEAAIRARADLVAVTERLADRENELQEHRRREKDGGSMVEALRRSVAELKQEAAARS